MANEQKFVIALVTNLDYGYTCRFCGRTEPGHQAVEITKEDGEIIGLFCCSHTLQEVLESIIANADPFAWICSVCGKTLPGNMLFCYHIDTSFAGQVQKQNPRYWEMTQYWPSHNHRPRNYRDPYL